MYLSLTILLILVSSSEMIIFNKFLSFNARCNNQGRHFSKRTSYKLLFHIWNGILAFLSSHFARCNNQGRYFDEGNVKKSFLSLGFLFFVLGLGNTLICVAKVKDQIR